MLMRSMEKKRSGEGGFTLVELLVVIAILGILAAIVVFAVGGVTDKGEDAANKTDCSVLAAAEEAYFASQPGTGSYVTDTAPGDGSAEEALVTAGFLHQPSTLHPDITAPVPPDVGYTIPGC
jgi:prepilin-type N-terminal cleavage/methylation domain-containing protein